MTVSEAWAKEVLHPWEPLLARVVVEAWRRFKTGVAADIRSDLTKRGQANAVWDLMAAEAEGVFADFPDVRAERKENSLFVILGGVVTVRFKKLTRSGVSQNLQTELQLDYRGQVPLEGFGPLPRLDVGYRVDPTGMNYEALLISCPEGRSAAWCYEIPLSVADRLKVETPLASRARQQRGTRVKGKHLRLIDDTGTED
jgi:hypothetical protein